MSKNREPVKHTLYRDQDGHYPLMSREWMQLKTLFTAVMEMEGAQNVLKERMQLTPGVWQRFRTAQSFMKYVEEEILKTIPSKKLIAMSHEMHNTEIIFRSKNAPTQLKNIVYVEKECFETLVNRCVAQDCFACEKTMRQARKCEIRTAIMDCLHYEIPRSGDDEECEFAGMYAMPTEDELAEARREMHEEAIRGK